MSERPAVSVVIPSHRRADSLRRTLLALETVGAGVFEVVVSLDGEHDATLSLQAEFEAPYPLRWISRPHRGRAAARNAGGAAARGDLLWFVDDDIAPAPSCLAAHREAHARGVRAVLGPVPVTYTAAGPLAAYRAATFAAGEGRLSATGYRPRAVDVYAGNLSLPARVFRDLGGFDESFALYGHEDFELALRLSRAGIELVYEPRALAVRYYEKSLREFARDTVAGGRTAVRFARKHPECLDDLPLGRYGRRGGLERFVLRTLLALDRATAVPSMAMVATTALAGRAGAARPRFYNRVFDYLYWHGVDRELRVHGLRGSLARRLEALRDASA